MKRSHRILTLITATAAMLAALSAPALAQFETTGDEGLAFGILCCYGFFGLLALAMFVLWIWMIIDLAQRQEHEFPNSTGNSKTIWLVVMLVTWAVGASGFAAIAYYFMIFKKVKRGTMPPPSSAGPMGGAGAPPPPGAAPPPPPAGGAGAPPPPPPG